MNRNFYVNLNSSDAANPGDFSYTFALKNTVKNGES
jgi:hypothetical protein